MRYTRFEFKGQKNFGIKQFIIKFIILVPLISIMIGFIISKFIVIPYISRIDGYKTDTPKAEYPKINNQNSEELFHYENIEPKRYYIIQVGVFVSNSNAEVLLNTVKLSEIPAFIFKDDQYNRVIAWTTNDSYTADRKLQELRSAGFDGIIKDLNIPAVDMPDKLKSDDKYILLSKFINNAGDSLDAYCSLIDRYGTKEIDYKTLKEKVIDIQGKIKEEEVRLETMKDDKVEMYDNAKIDSERIKSLMDGIGEDLAQLEEIKLKYIYLYRNIVENFNSSLIQ